MEVADQCLTTMIDVQELRRISGLKRLSIQNTEKDYLLELVLFLITEEGGKSFVFKGGTALYKFYSLNRFSEDLDFTLISSIKAEQLFQRILQKLSRVGVSGRIKGLDEYAQQINIRLELRGPLFNGDPQTLAVITCNLSRKEKPLYPAEQRKLFSSYPDLPAFDVFVMPLPELLAEKICALMTREKARDVYDIWFLLHKGARIEEKDINKKLKKYQLRFSSQLFRSKIEEKEGYWKVDLEGLIIGGLPAFEMVKKEIFEYLKH